MAAFVNVAVNLLVSTNASMVNKELVLKCAVFFTLFFFGGWGSCKGHVTVLMLLLLCVILTVCIVITTKIVALRRLFL